MSEKEKPDCWVMSANDGSVLTACSHKDGVMRGAISITGMDDETLIRYGWRIRPVKLVFLDKPGAELPSSD